jgi:hypothetical protein
LTEIQELVQNAYPDSEDACLEIRVDTINVVGIDGDMNEAACTPIRAIERLVEDAS